MTLSNENMLIASLMGSQVVEQLPRFAAVENELSKHVLPPISFIPLNNKADELYTAQDFEPVELWMNDKAKPESAQFFPFSFYSQDGKTRWTLPWEPLISITSHVRLIERNIAKSGDSLIGSIKERWSLDDYEITITGAFLGEKMKGKPAETYPRKDMEKLRDILLSPRAIKVECEALQILNITHLSIIDMSFPFTKGESVQAYEIKAKSDFPWNLIYKRKKGKIEVGEATQNLIPN